MEFSKDQLSKLDYNPTKAQTFKVSKDIFNNMLRKIKKSNPGMSHEKALNVTRHTINDSVIRRKITAKTINNKLTDKSKKTLQWIDSIIDEKLDILNYIEGIQ